MTGVSDIESVRQEYNTSAMRTSNARPYGGQEFWIIKAFPSGGRVRLYLYHCNV